MISIKSCKIETYEGELSTIIEFSDSIEVITLKGIDAIRDSFEGVINYHQGQIESYRSVLKQAEALEQTRLSILDHRKSQLN